MKKKLSILIPIFFGEKIFERCLKTLWAEGKNYVGAEWEILVFNNGFKEERLNELQKIYPQVKFFGEGENTGFAKANNFLIEKSRGDFILLLNQDVFISAEEILEMMIFLENNSQFSCVAPQLRYENGKEQYSCRPFPRNFGFLLTDFLTGGRKYRFFYSSNRSQEVDQPMASCLLFRGEVLRKLGGFDDHEHYFLYFNDADLSYRLNQMGGKSFFLSSVKATHLHGGSAYVLPELKRMKYWGKGLGRFWFKTGQNWYLAYARAFLITLGWTMVKIAKGLLGRK